MCVCVIHFIVLAIKYSAQECTCTWTFLSDPVYGNRFVISKNQTALYSETHDGHKTVSVELKDMQSKSPTHAHTHTLTRARAHTHTHLHVHVVFPCSLCHSAMNGKCYAVFSYASYTSCLGKARVASKTKVATIFSLMDG